MSEPVAEVPTTEVTEEKKELTYEQIKAELTKEILKKLGEQGCTREMLDSWKGMFGPLGFQPIGEQIYVIRSLLRKEWKEMNKVWQAQGQSEKPPTQLDIEEEIAAVALLWPRIDKHTMKTSVPAGVVTTLSESIQGHAGFVPNATPIVF